MDTAPPPSLSHLRVDVLGPLRLTVDGQPVEVRGQRRRAVLAQLALATGRVVSVSALIDALWPYEPPDTGHQALHSHISRLRRQLGPAAHRLRRHGAGYLLDLRAEDLDASAARRLAVAVTEQLRSDPAAAATDATEALGLWRGPALAEFADVGPLAAEAAGLHALREQLRDDALEARLAAGDRAVAADAASAAAEDPLRERTATLLMRALAADARPAEAMSVGAAYRRRLAAETGLDPGPSLAALEHEIATGGLAPAPPQTTRVVVRPVGPMVGRDRDREELLRLLDMHRTVTVSGPGGVGKTRLALEVAADLAERDGCEAVLVALATVTEQERVPEAVASTLGLRLGAHASVASLGDALADRSLLLVLDNCEHVASACRELVAAVQSRAARVRVLATSRGTLHVPGEYVVRLQPLPLPRDATDVDRLSRQPGVRAFLEHAQRRSPGFVLTAADADAVAEVIVRADGLPLAIELAAGQLAALPVTALRDRLGRALDVLSGERPDGDARHRTLRATIAWSYRLLGSGEQALLRALAPFPGGADLATVEQLAHAAAPGTDPLVVLSRLVDASLLSPDQQAAGRYTLLENVRAFLLEDLAERGERGRAEDGFLSWARRSADEMGARLHTADEPAADRWLRAELPNLRAARDLARDRGDSDTRIAVTLGLDEAGTFRDLQELWAWSLELADDPAVHGHPDEVAILGGAAEGAWLMGGQLELADRLSRRGLEVAERSGGRGRSYRCWGPAAAVALFRGEHDLARSRWLRAAETAPHPGGFLATAALAAGYAGDPSAGEVLARAREAERARPVPSHRAFIEYVAGELSAGSDTAQAVTAYTAAVTTARSCGAGFVEGVATVGLASVWTSTGDIEAAARGYQLLLGYWLRTGNLTQLWTTARDAAWLLHEQGHHRPAALLLVGADQAASAATVTGEAATRVRQTYARLQETLGPQGWDDVRRQARAMGPAQLTGLARAALADLA